MAISDINSLRRVVPRWRTDNKTLQSGELGAVKTGAVPSIDPSEFIKEKESAWLENQTMTYALDLVGAGIVLGITPTVMQAATFVLENKATTTSLATDLALQILGLQPQPSPANQGQPGENIRSLKLLRITQQRNAFVWVDLALNYVLLGQTQSAKEAITVALGLAPFERFVIRSAVRFWVHSKNPDRALALLRSNNRTPYDPWLIASEVAISTILETSPKFIKTGLQHLSAGNISPFSLSELASSVGSLEMFSGNNKKANRLFRTALVDPNENSLAQVLWSCRRSGLVLDQKDSSIVVPANAAEACALSNLIHQDWGKVVEWAKEWAVDEGFSSRPRVLGSGIASSLLDNPKEAERIAKEGLLTNPGHPALVNNIAFAQALQGRGDDALAIINTVNNMQLSPVETICLVATCGLAYFRNEDAANGRFFYERAIAGARRLDNVELRTQAELYFSRELIRIGDKSGEAMFEQACKEAEKIRASTLPALAIKMRLNPVKHIALPHEIKPHSDTDPRHLMLSSGIGE